MKAVLMSIRPQHVYNILNLIKLWEIRKKFQKDYVGWVYIYCCAEDKNGYLIKNRSTKKMEYTYNGFVASVCWLANRKVVARFWCDKVEPAYKFYVDELCQLACITKDELYEYAGGWYKTDDLLAIHITKLEIFDKPKEISEFYAYSDKKTKLNYRQEARWLTSLTRAPQSWCYVEI